MLIKHADVFHGFGEVKGYQFHIEVPLSKFDARLDASNHSLSTKEQEANVSRCHLKRPTTDTLNQRSMSYCTIASFSRNWASTLFWEAHLSTVTIVQSGLLCSIILHCSTHCQCHTILYKRRKTMAPYIIHCTIMYTTHIRYDSYHFVLRKYDQRDGSG